VFYGLKLHIVADLKRKLLSIKSTAGNTDDRELVFELTDCFIIVKIYLLATRSNSFETEFRNSNIIWAYLFKF